ncbi:MAG: C4-type zinc ribbon domain-containing protein [Bacteroidales bacterium]|jgi:predicted  nucleic acid-binding Zn-ribbon protein|nr:C4-type zinc ribbon domain-containing protein [Bacteroidales bacterium]
MAENTKERRKEEEKANVPVSEKLKALFELQTVVSEIDKFKALRGELPLEVQDLEDDIVGLKTRIVRLEDEARTTESAIANRKTSIKECEALIAKYAEQQQNVKNNREYDSLNKEVEFQRLEIELSHKKIAEFNKKLNSRKDDKNGEGYVGLLEAIEIARNQLKEREEDLQRKKRELDEITAETKIEEEKLKNKADKIESLIEPRLLNNFRKVRKNAHNGLAVVKVERDACGGCFNKIPPQRKLDIASHKKIIVCEYCGRILVDEGILSTEKETK